MIMAAARTDDPVDGKDLKERCLNGCGSVKSKTNEYPMPRIAVIFDMDGVIVDSEKAYLEIERQMYDELGIPVSQEEHLHFIGAAEKSMWQYMKDHYKIPAETRALVEEERKRFLARLDTPGGIPLMPGILELLEALADDDISSLVASSSSREIIEKVLQIHRIRHFFKDITGGDEVTHSKPAPDIFLDTAAKAGLVPEHCLVIEDSANGIRAARSAGMKVIALPGQHNGEMDLSEASRIVSSLHELDAHIIRQVLL
jgi:HAD superfamily hydrolase (TIGR01509 family)